MDDGVRTWVKPEEQQELIRQKGVLLERYRPLLEKAQRQLRRAETQFLNADDSDVESIPEHVALQHLDHAQSVCQFLTQIIWGVEFSETLDDLRYYQYDT